MGLLVIIGNKPKVARREVKATLAAGARDGRFLQEVGLGIFKIANCYRNGTRSKATMFITLIKGFIAGPAVSL